MDKAKFAPFNDNIEDNPDKNYIAGPYSTFDIELSKMARKKPKTIAEKKALFERANRNISISKLCKFNTYVGDEYIALLSRKDMKERLLKFDSMSDLEILNFAQDVIHEMSKLFDKTARLIPRMPVIATDKISKMAFVPETDKNIDDELWVNLNNPENRIVEDFFNGLLHEFIHMVDYYVPNLGPLGAQISNALRGNTVQPDEDKDVYFINPREINAYMNHKRIPDLIRAIITGSADKEKQTEVNPFVFFRNITVKE